MKLRIFAVICLLFLCWSASFGNCARAQGFPVCEAVQEEKSLQEKLEEAAQKAWQYAVELLNSDQLIQMIKDSGEALYNTIVDIGDGLAEASCLLPGQEDRTDCPVEDSPMDDFCTSGKDSKLQEAMNTVKSQFPAAGIITDAATIIITARRKAAGIANRAPKAAEALSGEEEVPENKAADETKEKDTGDETANEEEEELTEEEKRLEEIKDMLSVDAAAGQFFQQAANEQTVRSIYAEAGSAVTLSQKTTMAQIINADRQVMLDQMLIALITATHLHAKIFEGDTGFYDDIKSAEKGVTQ